MVDYAERPAPPGLGGAVAAVWRTRVAGSGDPVLRTIPDGSIELVLDAELGTLVYGPDRTWRELTLRPGAEYHGVRLRPGAAAALPGIDPRALAGRVVSREDSGLRGGLDERDPASWTAGILGRLAASVPADPLVRAAVLRMGRAPGLGVAGLSRELAISERQLRRRFERAVGLPPWTFARIARVRRALAHAERTREPWAAVAYASGFADQAHLAREVKALTGSSPSRLWGARGGAAP